MMKAILVIDVPTESLDNVIASVNVCEQREGYNIILKRMGKMGLKPLPEKKPIDKTLYFDGYDNLVQSALARGYNAYHDEIIGEK